MEQRPACPVCGKVLNWGEFCEHQTQGLQVDAAAIKNSDINRMARPLLEAIRRDFEDPKFQKAFEKWQKERAKRGA